VRIHSSSCFCGVPHFDPYSKVGCIIVFFIFSSFSVLLCGSCSLSKCFSDVFDSSVYVVLIICSLTFLVYLLIIGSNVACLFGLCVYTKGTSVLAMVINCLSRKMRMLNFPLERPIVVGKSSCHRRKEILSTQGQNRHVRRLRKGWLNLQK